MSLSSWWWHLANLVAPALALGALAAGLGKLVWWRAWRRRSWWSLAWPAALVCAGVAVAGLLVTGHDGRMATYGAMVLACAAVLGWRGFGPRR